MPNPRSRRGRSEGSIHRRKDGLWCGVVSLGVHAGKRIRRTVYGHTKAEAAEKLRELQSSVDAGRLPDAKSMTLETWLERWLKLIETSVEPGTHEPYRICVRKHIAPRIGGIRIQRIRPVDVESFFAQLLRDGASASLVRKVGTTLSIAMNHAVRSQLIPNNPTQGVRRPKVKRAKIAVLDSAQVAALVRACDGARLGALWLLLLDSGMRPGEALALHWPDLDFAAKRVSVTKNMANTGEPKAPKTERGRRMIELTPGTIDALHAHRKAMLTEGRDVRRGPIFVNARGGVIVPNDVTRGHLHPFLVAAGIPSFGAYALRHTCATMLLGANVNPKIVSERLGHSTIAMTLDIYSHVLPGMQSAATDVLGRLLGG